MGTLNHCPTLQNESHFICHSTLFFEMWRLRVLLSRGRQHRKGGIEDGVRKVAYEREGAFQEAIRLRNNSWCALQAD